MAWTTPKTDWATGELVTAADVNAIGENLVALKQLSAVVSHTTTADIDVPIGTIGNTFVDVATDNLNLTITTAGGDVMVHFHGSIKVWDRRFIYLDIEVDGARLGGDDGTFTHQLVEVSGGKHANNLLSFTRLIQNLSAGSHTFKLQWKGDYNYTIKAGAQFWVREI